MQNTNYLVTVNLLYLYNYMYYVYKIQYTYTPNLYIITINRSKIDEHRICSTCSNILYTPPARNFIILKIKYTININLLVSVRWNGIFSYILCRQD